MSTEAPARTHQWRGVIEEYRDRLDIPANTPVITLREGGTPMVRSGWLSDLLGAEVWLKVEGDNPTGSFKDRGMTVALSVAVGEGAEAVVCASTGNTSASMAAYAARAGIKPLVLVPQGKIAAGKLAQAIVHGAQVIMVRGNFDDCLRLSRGLADHYPVSLVNSVNPMRLQGQKTASFEIVDFLGDAPDIHVLPTGNAGNISAYWLGYREAADGRLRHPQAGDAGLAGGRRRAARRRQAGGQPGDRWPPRSASATRRPGSSRWRPPSSPVACSARSPTTRSSVHKGIWPLATASSSSPRPPPGSPACWSSTPRVPTCRGAPSWSP